VIVIKAQQHRSLEQNRAEALQRLMDMVQSAQRVPRLRRATHPTRASKRRRLQGQALRGQIKAHRASRVGID
jgi:ribosome-associated protein